MLLWRELEKAACDAEAQLEQMGQGAASPEAAAIAIKAPALREGADRWFKGILAMLPQ